MRNFSLDLIKLISAYTVVCLHFAFPGYFGMLINAIARFAVPLFFLCSGYFCYNNDYNKIKAKIKHILKLFIFTYLLYFIYYYIESWRYMGIDGVTNYLYKFINIERIINFIIFNCTTIQAHMWFLLALIYCYIIYYILKKFNVNKKIYYFCAIILLFIQILLGEFLSLFNIKTNIIFIRNFLFIGFPFFTIGMMTKEKANKHYNSKFLIGGFVLGLLETIISFRFSNTNELFIGSILMSISLFVLCLNNFKINQNKILANLVNCSTLIYIIHPMIANITTSVLIFFNLYYTTIFQWLFPIIVCVISTIVSFFINHIINKLKEI